MIEMNEDDFFFFFGRERIKKLHAFLHKRMGDLSDVAVSYFCSTVKRAIDQCMIDFFDEGYDIAPPFLPFVDIGNEEQFLVRTFNDEANGFGKLIPVGNKNGLYLERGADVFPFPF